MANYRRELRMGADISRKGKIEKMMKYVKRIKKVQEEVGVVLKKDMERDEKTSRQRVKRGGEMEERQKTRF